MTDDKTYQLLVNKMHEVAIVPPQELGPFTIFYKRTTSYFKNSLWKTTGIVSFILSLFLYFLLGSSIVKLVSVLQFGF